MVVNEYSARSGVSIEPLPVMCDTTDRIGPATSA